MQLKAIIALACATKALQRPRVIIAPAQFGVPKDYDDLSALLRQRGHTVACAPLSRLSWLRIVPSVFTEAFFKGELKPQGTLDFFFEALDAAVADVGPDEDIAILGHSIGGWVARAWVVDRGEQRVKRFVTLGTPHNEPPEGLFSNIDQTRGLLKYVRANCPPDPAIFTCVAGTATSTAALGDVFKLDAWDEELRRSPLLEALVSLPSYLALSGRNPFGVKGDGLIPVATASAEINQCVRPAWRYYLLFWQPRRSTRVLGVLARGVLGLFTRTFVFRTGWRARCGAHEDVLLLCDGTEHYGQIKTPSDRASAGHHHDRRHVPRLSDGVHARGFLETGAQQGGRGDNSGVPACVEFNR